MPGGRSSTLEDDEEEEELPQSELERLEAALPEGLPIALLKEGGLTRQPSGDMEGVAKLTNKEKFEVRSRAGWWLEGGEGGEKQHAA